MTEREREKKERRKERTKKRARPNFNINLTINFTINFNINCTINLNNSSCTSQLSFAKLASQTKLLHFRSFSFFPLHPLFPSFFRSTLPCLAFPFLLRCSVWSFVFYLYNLLLYNGCRLVMFYRGKKRREREKNHNVGISEKHFTMCGGFFALVLVSFVLLMWRFRI